MFIVSFHIFFRPHQRKQNVKFTNGSISTDTVHWSCNHENITRLRDKSINPDSISEKIRFSLEYLNLMGNKQPISNLKMTKTGLRKKCSFQNKVCLLPFWGI